MTKTPVARFFSVGIAGVFVILVLLFAAYPHGSSTYPDGLTTIERKAAERAIYNVSAFGDSAGTSFQVISVRVVSQDDELCSSHGTAFTAEVRAMWGPIPSPFVYLTGCDFVSAK